LASFSLLPYFWLQAAAPVCQVSGDFRAGHLEFALSDDQEPWATLEAAPWNHLRGRVRIGPEESTAEISNDEFEVSARLRSGAIILGLSAPQRTPQGVLLAPQAVRVLALAPTGLVSVQPLRGDSPGPTLEVPCSALRLEESPQIPVETLIEGSAAAPLHRLKSEQLLPVGATSPITITRDHRARLLETTPEGARILLLHPSGDGQELLISPEALGPKAKPVEAPPGNALLAPLGSRSQAETYACKEPVTLLLAAERAYVPVAKLSAKADFAIEKGTAGYARVDPSAGWLNLLQPLLAPPEVLRGCPRTATKPRPAAPTPLRLPAPPPMPGTGI
jgi:hypothetical protein